MIDYTTFMYDVVSDTWLNDEDAHDEQWTLDCECESVTIAAMPVEYRPNEPRFN